MKINFDKLNEYRENNRIEVKKATGGLPGSLWETYSAFANTNGGVILLGADEKKDKSLVPVKLDDPEKLVKQFWDNINNTQKVNLNILTDKDVSIVDAGAFRIICIEVPRADRHDKPIHIGNDPYKGSYRRNGEGDYRCTRDEVRAMLRDQPDVSMDTRVLDELEMDAFEQESIAGYRRRLELSRPDHVWLKLPNEEFLHKLGAAEYGEDKRLHPTAAGILMFGEEYRIVREFPYYFLDYREVEPGQERWVHRFVSSSGDWSGNLFDFYYRAINRIAQIIRTPFKLDDEAFRIDDTPVHKATREVLANTLINAYYYGSGGVVIIRGQQEISFANPGGFRIPINAAIDGGFSDPRNVTLMKMFNLLDIGERAGSGIPSIFSVWKDQGWPLPEIVEKFEPDRSTVVLKLFSDSMSSDKISDKYLSDILSDILSDRERAVLTLLAENPSLTAPELADKLNVTRQTINNRIKSLKEKGIIHRVGSDRVGHWEIVSSI